MKIKIDASAEMKEKYIDPVDAAVAAWSEKYPERYNTIEHNTEDGYFNVWVGNFSFFPFQMDDKLTGNWSADYKNVLDYLEDTLVRNLEKCIAEMYVEHDESWVNAIEDTENLLTLSDTWELGFTVETVLGEWAKTDLWHILHDNSRRILSVKLDGKRAKYDYPADVFRRDVRHFIDKNVEKNLKNPGRYASIIASYLYNFWNDDFGIFFGRYDEHEGIIYDDEYREPVENNIATA